MTENKKILIVEDDGIIGERLRITFENWGYLTINADTGDEAIRLALSEHPNMVLMDVILKGNMNGVEAAHAIHEHLDIPIVYLTAYSDEHLLNQTKNTNSYGYLIKPVRDRELWATMEMAFHKYRADKLIQEKNRELTKEIAERQRVEDALRKSEEGLSRAYHFAEATIDALTAHVCVLDEFGRILKVNKAWREFADANSTLQGQYFIGSNYLSICDAAAQLNCKEAISVASGIRAMINGETDHFSIEYPCHSPTEFRCFMINTTCFHDGAALRFVVAHENITERKQAEQELHEQRDMLETIFESSPNILMLINKDGRMEKINRAGVSFVSHPAEKLTDLFGCEVFECVNAFKASICGKKIACTKCPVRSRVMRTFKTNQPCFNESASLTLLKNNQQITFDFLISTLKIRTKGGDKVLITITDISTLKKVEAQLQQAKEAAEAATRAKSEFLAGMSHEIRTPLNAIIGFSRIVSDKEVGELNETQSEYLGNVVKSGEHLLSLISNILDFSKIEAGKLELETLDFNLNDVVEEVVNLLRFTAEEKSILLTSHIDSDVPAYLRGDPTRLRQILLNLVNNAVKFTPKGEISIHVSSADRPNPPPPFPEREGGEQTEDSPLRFGEGQGVGLHFALSDTGIGIPKDRLDRMFQAFSQADMSTTRKFGGTGLGLAISKSLVEKMNGQIGVESVEGKGSTFWFTAKFEKSAKFKVQSAKSDNETATTLHSSLCTLHSPLSLLLVEDNELNQKLALHILKKLGFEADVANNGREAIRALQTVAYDLVLMDIQMPVMDGLDAAKFIRNPVSEVLNPNVPIVAMTAHAMQSDRDRCSEVGMNDYISKPINPDELLRIIRNQLSAPTPKRRGESSALSPFPFREGVRGVRFDKAEFLNRIGGSEAFCKEMMAAFVQYFPIIVEQLKSALNENDAKSARLHAHSLKGMSMQISAYKLADLASDMENYAINGELDKIRSLISRLDEEFESLKAVVNDICPSPPQFKNS